MSLLNQKLLTEIRRIADARTSSVKDYLKRATKAEALATTVTNLGFHVARSQCRSPHGILWTVQVTKDGSDQRGIGIRKSEAEAIRVAAEGAGASLD